MSVIDRTSRDRWVKSEYDDRNSLAVVAGYGAVGAAALALLLFVVLLLAWVTDPRSGGDWTAVLGLSGDAWTLSHGGRLTAPVVGPVILTPLLLTALAVFLARSAARPVVVAGSTGRWWPTLSAFVGGYLVAGLAISALGYLSTAKPVLPWVIPGALLVPAAGFVWAVARDRHDDNALRADLVQQWERIPPRIRKGVRPGLEGAGALAGIGLIVLLVAVLTHLSRISAIQGTFDSGAVGLALLWGGQLTALPNAVAWGTTWAAGGGLHLGPVGVTLTQVHAGTLPAIPLLGAIPEAGALSPVTLAAPAAIVLVGVGIGWRSTRRLSVLSSLPSKLMVTAVACGIACGAILLVALVGRAGVGTRAMAYVGPTAAACLALLVVVTATALLTTTLIHWLKAHD